MRGEAAASHLCPRRPPFCVSFVSVHAETALACLHFPAPGECGLWIPHCFPQDRRSRQWNRGRWNEEGPAPPAAALPPAAAGALHRHLCWVCAGAPPASWGTPGPPLPTAFWRPETPRLACGPPRSPGRAGRREKLCQGGPQAEGEEQRSLGGRPAGAGGGRAPWRGVRGAAGGRGARSCSQCPPRPSRIPGAVSPSLTSCGAPPGAALSCTVATRVESFK